MEAEKKTISCDFPGPSRMKNGQAVKAFLLANALVVSSGAELVHFGGESEGERQEVWSARGFDDQLLESRVFPMATAPAGLSALLSASPSLRGRPTSRFSRAVRLRPVGWEWGLGIKSSAVAVQGMGTSALLEVSTTTTTYENLGPGVCACRNPTRENNLERCHGTVFLTPPPSPPAPLEEDCRRICSDAADCMAYQYSRNCILYLWYQLPTGLFRPADINSRSDLSRDRRMLLEWAQFPCMRKNVQVTDRRARFQYQLGSENFAIMPQEGLLNGGHGAERFCTCRATTSTSDLDDYHYYTGEKETVCRVADEKENMSQEEAESLCLERNRRAAPKRRRREALLRRRRGEAPLPLRTERGCAGFMSFTPLFSAQHPKAKHKSVLFFSGDQTVSGIAATKEQYEQKGGPKTGPAISYLNLTPDGMQAVPAGAESVGGFETGRLRSNLPRCVYYVGGAEPEPGQTERTKVSWMNLDPSDLEFLFYLAVGGVAVFSVALLVVAAFLVVACRKHQKSSRLLGGIDVGKDRKAKQELLSRDQTNRDGPEGAARVHDEKAPQTPTLPLASVPKDEKDKPTTPTRRKETTKKRDHAGAPPWQRRAGAPSGRQVRDVAEDVARGFPSRYADYRLDLRDQQPLPLQGRAIMGLQAEELEAQEGMDKVPAPENPRAHSTGKGGREGTPAAAGTHPAASSSTFVSASLSLRGGGEIDVDWLLALAPNGDGASCTDTVLVAPVNSSVTGGHSRPTSETPEGTSCR